MIRLSTAAFLGALFCRWCFQPAIVHSIYAHKYNTIRVSTYVTDDLPSVLFGTTKESMQTNTCKTSSFKEPLLVNLRKYHKKESFGTVFSSFKEAFLDVWKRFPTSYRVNTYRVTREDKRNSGTMDEVYLTLICPPEYLFTIGAQRSKQINYPLYLCLENNHLNSIGPYSYTHRLIMVLDLKEQPHFLSHRFRYLWMIFDQDQWPKRVMENPITLKIIHQSKRFHLLNRAKQLEKDLCLNQTIWKNLYTEALDKSLKHSFSEDSFWEHLTEIESIRLQRLFQLIFQNFWRHADFVEGIARYGGSGFIFEQVMYYCFGSFEKRAIGFLREQCSFQLPQLKKAFRLQSTKQPLKQPNQPAYTVLLDNRTLFDAKIVLRGTQELVVSKVCGVLFKTRDIRRNLLKRINHTKKITDNQFIKGIGNQSYILRKHIILGYDLFEAPSGRLLMYTLLSLYDATSTNKRTTWIYCDMKVLPNLIQPVGSHLWDVSQRANQLARQLRQFLPRPNSWLDETSYLEKVINQIPYWINSTLALVLAHPSSANLFVECLRRRISRDKTVALYLFGTAHTLGAVSIKKENTPAPKRFLIYVNNKASGFVIPFQERDSMLYLHLIEGVDAFSKVQPLLVNYWVDLGNKPTNDLAQADSSSEDSSSELLSSTEETHYHYHAFPFPLKERVRCSVRGLEQTSGSLGFNAGIILPTTKQIKIPIFHPIKQNSFQRTETRPSFLPGKKHPFEERYC